MNFNDIADILGVSDYPEELNNICISPATVSNFKRSNIEFLDEQYGVFGEYLPSLLECLSETEKSEALYRYGYAAVEYMAHADCSDCVKIKLPTTLTDDPVLCYYPLLILAALLPYGIKKYRERGFSDNEIYNTLHSAFVPRVKLAETLNKRSGLDIQGYSWLRLYAKAMVFPAGVFNITPKKLADNIIVLRNKESGKFAIVMTDGLFHRSGAVLGSAGLTDEQDSFYAEYRETDAAYIGHEVINSFVSDKISVYKKSEWEISLKKGDGIVGIHIPRGADLSPEKITASFKLALELTKERYPEFEPKMIHCASWMLDPQLADILGDGAKISGFLGRFKKFPCKSDGKAIFNFVFPKIYDSYETLPESTTLQRKLKKLYIDGGFIYVYGGVVTDI